MTDQEEADTQWRAVATTDVIPPDYAGMIDGYIAESDGGELAHIVLRNSNLAPAQFTDYTSWQPSDAPTRTWQEYLRWVISAGRACSLPEGGIPLRDSMAGLARVPLAWLRGLRRYGIASVGLTETDDTPLSELVQFAFPADTQLFWAADAVYLQGDAARMEDVFGQIYEWAVSLVVKDLKAGAEIETEALQAVLAGLPANETQPDLYHVLLYQHYVRRSPAEAAEYPYQVMWRSEDTREPHERAAETRDRWQQRWAALSAAVQFAPAVYYPVTGRRFRATERPHIIALVGDPCTDHMRLLGHVLQHASGEMELVYPDMPPEPLPPLQWAELVVDDAVWPITPLQVGCENPRVCSIGVRWEALVGGVAHAPVVPTHAAVAALPEGRVRIWVGDAEDVDAAIEAWWVNFAFTVHSGARGFRPEWRVAAIEAALKSPLGRTRAAELLCEQLAYGSVTLAAIHSARSDWEHDTRWAPRFARCYRGASSTVSETMEVRSVLPELELVALAERARPAGDATWPRTIFAHAEGFDAAHKMFLGTMGSLYVHAETLSRGSAAMTPSRLVITRRSKPRQRITLYQTDDHLFTGEARFQIQRGMEPRDPTPYSADEMRIVISSHLRHDGAPRVFRPHFKPEYPRMEIPPFTGRPRG